MSDNKIEVKSKSKPKINVKARITKNKPKNNLNSLTPNKYFKPKEGISYNNKININNNNTVLGAHSNNYNIHNNISININIDMSNNNNNNNNNSKQKTIFNPKNKNQVKNKPIRIKKEDLKNNNSLIFNTLKLYTSKNNSKKSPFHIRIKSANMGFKDFKYNTHKINKINKNNNTSTKKNFNLTTTSFNPKKEVNNNNNISNNNNNTNKTAIEPKNISIEKVEINDNDIKKDYSTSITAEHLNNDKSLFKNKNKTNQSNKNKTNKSIGKKRNNFSPTINRELLNRKQNLILNYSIGNRKNNNTNYKTIINENKNKTLKPKSNIKDITLSPFINNKKMSWNKKNNVNSKDHSANIASLLSKNQITNNSKKQIFNYKAKSPMNNNNKFELRNSKYNKNNKNINKNDFNPRTPSMGNKNLKKGNKTKNFNEKPDLKKDNNKNISKEKDGKTSEENKKEEEKKKNNDEEKRKKEEEENNKKQKPKQNNDKENDKKKILNQSKSQNDINPDFIKKNLENKKNEEPSQNLKPSEPAVKKLLRMESICKKGFAGPGVKKTNQDNFFIYKNFLDSPDNIFLGVCDGHGMFGQDISGYLVNHLPQNLNNALLKENLKIISSQKDFPQISNAISLTFVQTNINLVNDEKVDSTFSGTTCSSLLFCPEKIITANVGDSRCVLGKFDGKNWKAKNLTRDHKPNEEDEKKRITEKGGRIEAYKDDDGDFVGPERVWLKEENIPGLAMSRSFGDEVAHTVGVVSQPEIFEYNFLNEDKFILLASDGIWEFISSDECVNIVKDYYLKDDIDGALNYLYKESSKRWIMEEEVIDDITLIIMFLS